MLVLCGLALLQTACADATVASTDNSVTDYGVSLARRRPKPPVVVTPPVDTAATVPPVTPPPAPVPPVVVPPVVVPPVVPPPPLPGGDAYFGFTGSPPTPIPFNEDGWDVQVYSRNADTWYFPEAMDAHHGADCAGYPNVHRVARYEDMVFRCRDHIMTAINASGYGAIVLTPDRMVSWASGEGVIRFDLSTLQTSSRDWINVFVSAFDSHMAVPATLEAVALNGPARDGIYFEMLSNGNICPRFVRNFIVTRLECREEWKALSDKIVVSATLRSTVEIRLTNSRVKVSLPNEGVVFSDVALPSALPFTEGVVQFGHYSYTPEKECTRPTGCPPNTWHWDEIHLAPSVPFTIIRADRRFVDGSGGTVTFNSPAPRGAKMGFFAYGREPDLSFDGGATWQAPVQQASVKLADPDRQYFTPIPEGTTKVMLRPARPIAFWGDLQFWMARDFTIWVR